MSTLLLCWQLLAAMGGVSLDSLAIAGQPVDLSTAWQDVPLRAPLTAQTGKPRLILYIRGLASVGLERDRVVEQLPWLLPAGAVEATVWNRAGKAYALRMTGYSFFRGMPGLVLESDDIPKGETLFRLAVRGQRPVADVVMIWLDSLGRSRPD